MNPELPATPRRVSVLFSHRLPKLLALMRIAGTSIVSIIIVEAASGENWQSGEGYRFKELLDSGEGKAGFIRLPPQMTGIWFTNTLPEARGLTNTILPGGSGVASGDIDGDGWADLFFAGLDGGSRLYRNLGNWRFEDVTASAGVSLTGIDSTGAVFADIDGDGDLDLLVNTIGSGTHIFFNNGKGRFTRSSQVLNLGYGGMSLSLADADGDGDLDLYVTNYRVSTLLDAPGTRFNIRMVDGQLTVGSIDGKPLTDPEWTNRFRFKVELGPDGRGRFAHEELGQPDLFCLNNGKGFFEPVSWTGGAFADEHGKPLIEPPYDWGLSVMFRDLNGDGYPDLYICNDFDTPDRFWINDGKGRFRAAPFIALRQTSMASMGLDVADIDRDGHDDFMVVDMLSRKHSLRLVQRNVNRAVLTSSGRDRHKSHRNTLFLNRGDGTYAEIAQLARLDATEWSWSPIFVDVDLDGFEDLLVPNGFERDNMNIDVHNQIKQTKTAQRMRTREELMLRRLFPRLDTRNLAFRNLGNCQFEEVSAAWGFNSPVISQGTCLVDLDNDGDLDVVVNNMNAVAGIYRNNSPAPRLAVRLKGLPPNTRGVGANIEVRGGPVYQKQHIISGGRYLSSDDPMRTFAAGTLENQLAITVTWRSGKQSIVTGARGNRLYEIDESHARPASSDKTGPRQPAPPFFVDVSDQLGHTHVDVPFNDTARQPLLPIKLSQLGPGVCWIDIDGDGVDDLVVGGGTSGKIALFKNNGSAGFQQLSRPDVNRANQRDQTAVLGLRQDSKTTRLLIGSSNYEDGKATGGAVLEYGPDQDTVSELVPATDSSTGPMSLADIDGDGDLDLFVGGRVVPGRYPEPASSRIFRNETGRFVLDEANSKLFEGVGLVSGSVFTDLNGNGLPDLVLACEWGPLRVFRNTGGNFSEVTAQLGLDEYRGWWLGVNAGDFDGDGQLDLVATNWGRNSRYERFRDRPLRVYYGDFNRDATVQILEAYWDPETEAYVPWRRLDEAAQGMPFLQGAFPTLTAYSQASIEQILGQRLDQASILEAQWLESTVFMNRGDRFEPIILPFEAQLAPAFAASVGDLDGDGHEDIYLSQNILSVPGETSPYDAGRGLWLRGKGDGTFTAVDGSESGLKIYGEQRGAALADFDGDGRLDLAVAQHRAETKLFRNQNAQPGLRVRARGAPGNPDGIGAVIRLGTGHTWGPAREIRAGSGYWSQDSGVQVMAAAGAPTEILVRWPGGKTFTAKIPANALEIEAGYDGKVERLR
jgi:enediyne biosynthesis protein E4